MLGIPSHAPSCRWYCPMSQSRPLMHGSRLGQTRGLCESSCGDVGGKWDRAYAPVTCALLWHGDLLLRTPVEQLRCSFHAFPRLCERVYKSSCIFVLASTAVYLVACGEKVGGPCRYFSSRCYACDDVSRPLVVSSAFLWLALRRLFPYDVTDAVQNTTQQQFENRQFGHVSLARNMKS